MIKLQEMHIKNIYILFVLGKYKTYLNIIDGIDFQNTVYLTVILEEL